MYCNLDLQFVVDSHHNVEDETTLELLDAKCLPLPQMNCLWELLKEQLVG